MHEALLQYHNELVKPWDHVSFLGDVTLLRGGKDQQQMLIDEVKRYHGHKRLYLGNHDHMPMAVYKEAGFEKIYATWRADEGFICSHIPLHPRSLLTVKANVHGHIHQMPAYEPVHFTGKEPERDAHKPRWVPYINVSVEAVDYKPVHLDTILAMIRKVNEQKEN